ncbi:MAG: N-acetylmuramoyl-L-alanine amidase [bacterium]
MKKHTSRAAPFSAAVIIFAFFLNCLASASASSRLVKVRYSSSKGYTRVVFDLSQAARFKHYFSDDRQSFFIELLDCENIIQKDSIALKHSLVRQVKIIDKNKPSGLLVQISLDHLADCKIFTLKPNQEMPHRLVADFFEQQKQQEQREQKKQQEQQKQQEPNQKVQQQEVPKQQESNQQVKEKPVSATPEKKPKKRIVVIDPGHGGADPGAISRNGTKEKDIVLQIARDLKNYLEQKNPSIQIHLTRDGDYFIPLRKRITIAHKKKADLFISLHTNASTRKEVHGASVFYLSETGASDKASDLLAARENSSDLIAGVKLSEDKLVNTILIDLVQTYTINESVQICNATLQGLQDSGFQNQGIRCANFAVLKSPSIPSALLEIGYITNQKDEKKLLSREGRQHIVQQLATSVLTYLTRGEQEEPLLTQPSAADSKEKAFANTQF